MQTRLPVAQIVRSALLVGALGVAPLQRGLARAPEATQLICAWTGGSGLWTDSSKWSCGGVPGATDDVTINGAIGTTVSIPAGVLAQAHNVVVTQGDIRGDGELRVNDLTLQTPANAALAMVFNGTLTVGGAWRLIGGWANIGHTVAANLEMTGTASIQVNSGALLTVTQSLKKYGGSLIALGSQGVRIATGAVATVQSFHPDDNPNDNLLNVRNDGVLTILTGSKRAVANNVVNYGDLYVYGSDTVRPVVDFLKNYGNAVFDGPVDFGSTGVADQLDGSLTISGSMPLPSTVRVYGGSLTGQGSLGTIDHRGGWVAPGNPTGVLAVGNYFVDDDHGGIWARIGGPNPVAGFGVLRVGTSAQAPPVVRVSSLNGYVPRLTDTFDVMTYTARNSSSFSGDTPLLDAGATAWSGFGATADAQRVRILQGQNFVRLAANYSAPVATGQALSDTLSLRLDNPTNGAATLKQIQVTLPLSQTYLPGTARGLTSGEPLLSNSNGRQRLTWSFTSNLPGLGNLGLTFGVTVAAPQNMLSQRADVAALIQTGGSTREVRVSPEILIYDPVLVGGTLAPSAGATTLMNGVPVMSVRNANRNEPILIRTRPTCPLGLTCGAVVSATVTVLGVRYPMIAGAPPTVTAADTAAQADVPEWHRWIPGLSCAQQLPGIYCQPQPGACPFPILLDLTYESALLIKTLLGCGGLYDPRGIVRNALTNQPIANATVTLYRDPVGLPDAPPQSNQCRTIDTRPGGVSGNWTSLPAATGGLLADAFSAPALMQPAVNPQKTASDGRYGWDVATGCWHVTVSAPGYGSVSSAWVGVPPEVTDLDILLQPGATQPVYLPLVRR